MNQSNIRSRVICPQWYELMRSINNIMTKVSKNTAELCVNRNGIIGISDFIAIW